jgi:hypothetical protein
MSLMDKAKKLAEQAQTKLDEVQKQFNERQSGSSTTPQERADAATPPHGDPLADPAKPTGGDDQTG